MLDWRRSWGLGNVKEREGALDGYSKKAIVCWRSQMVCRAGSFLFTKFWGFSAHIMLKINHEVGRWESFGIYLCHLGQSFEKAVSDLTICSAFQKQEDFMQHCGNVRIPREFFPTFHHRQWRNLRYQFS